MRIVQTFWSSYGNPTGYSVMSQNLTSFIGKLSGCSAFDLDNRINFQKIIFEL